jgi:hypothetical protein
MFNTAKGVTVYMDRGPLALQLCSLSRYMTSLLG